MKKRVLALLLALVMIVGCMAACGGTGNSSNPVSAGNNSTANNTPDDTSSVTPTTGGPDPTDEFYEFTIYANFDWFSVKTWGEDAASKYMNDMFNINVLWTKPDSDADAKLRTMMVGDELPEVVCMQPGSLMNELARNGYFQDLAQFEYEGNPFTENVSKIARDMGRIDGIEYGVQVWPHGKATGGNMSWIINTELWEEAGSPALETLEDLHQFMLWVKEKNPTSYSGAQVWPWLQTNDASAFRVIEPIYRSLGQPNLVSTYYTQQDGKLDFGVNNEKYIEALKIANQWYNEGLFPADEFTMNGDQFNEMLTNAQAGILYYDFSQDSINHFRQIVQENTDGASSYEIVGYAPNYKDGVLSQYPIYPPVEKGMITYGEECSVMGWKSYNITNKATNGQRIFDLFGYMMTAEGSIVIMYGPEGMLWEGTDENGTPLLKKAESEFTTEEKDAAGFWFWPHPANSDYIDPIKFAVNDLMDDDKKDFVVDAQAHGFSFNYDNPRVGQKFSTDQNCNLTFNLDPTSNEAIAKTQIEDKLKAGLPQLIMAPDAATFDSMLKELQDFCNQTECGAVEIMQAKFDENVAIQGYNAYDPDYDVYRQK